MTLLDAPKFDEAKERRRRRILSVSADERDVVYDLISTSRESQYDKADPQPAYLMKFDDIESVAVHE